MNGQLIFALDERLLVVKPGLVRGTDFGGQVASIHYADIDNIETNVAASLRAPTGDTMISVSFLQPPHTAVDRHAPLSSAFSSLRVVIKPP
jgi:hypothetical protein